MRTLKKTICVVLTIVMVMGLCAVGATAASLPSISDFYDSNDIQNREAVAVMTGIGVINGMDDGGFDPEGYLTREQAAKVITYMVLGASQAEALKANSAPFGDVSASRWSAGYIAYCRSEGVIAGVGGGRFDPTGRLTGYQWGKMLLVALGYDPAVEGFEGTNWAINVAKKALAVGIFEGNLDGNFTVSCTRDEACLYAFNAMQGDLVEYKTTGTSITVGGTTITTGGSAATKVAGSSSASASYNNDGDGVMQFCEQYWNRLKLSTATNSFGSPSSRWIYKSETIGTFADEVKDSVVISSLSTNSRKTLSYWIEEIDSDYEIAASASNYTNVYFNGQKLTDSTHFAASVYNGNIGADGAHAIKMGIGDVISVYDTDDDDVLDTIIVTRYTGAKISSVDTDVSTTDARDGVTAYITIGGIDYKPGTDDGDRKLPGYNDRTYVKNAIIAAAYKYSGGAPGDTIIDSYRADYDEGTVRAYTAGEDISIDGTKYTFSEGLSTNNYNPGDYNGIYAVYTDRNGYAIYINTVEAGTVSSDAFYVNYLFKRTRLDTYGTPCTTYSAQVVSMTGEDSVLTLGYTSASGRIYGNIEGYTYTQDASGAYFVRDDGTIGDSGTPLVGSPPKYDRASAALSDNTLYTRSYDSSREFYKLTAYVSGSTYYVNRYDLSGYTSAIKTSNTKLGGYYVNDGTRYIVVEGTGSDIDVTVKTGGVSMAASSYSDIDVIATKSGSSYIAQYVIISTGSYTSGDYDDVLYCKSNSRASVDGGYQYTLYGSDGESAYYKVSNSSLTEGKFYTYKIDNKGIYTLNEIDVEMAPYAGSWDGQNGVLYAATFESAYHELITFNNGGSYYDDIETYSARIVDLHTTLQADYDVPGRTTYSGKINTLAKMNDVAASYTITCNVYVDDDGVAVLFITDVSRGTSYSLGDSGNTVWFYSDALCANRIYGATYGTTVYIKATSGTLGTATVIYSGGTVGTAHVDTGIRSFSMPAGNVTSVSVAMSYSLADTTVADVKFYSDAACTAEIFSANTGNTVYVKAITGNLESANVIWTGGTLSGISVNGSHIGSFSMPAGNVTDVNATISYSLGDSSGPDVKFYSDDACTTEIARANIGDDVYVKAITGNLEGANVVWTGGTLSDISVDSINHVGTFLMPAGSVTNVAATISYSLADETPADVKFYSDSGCTIEISRANVGATVYVKAVSGTLAGATVHYASTSIPAAEVLPSGSGIYSFTMPAYNVTNVVAAYSLDDSSGPDVKFYSDAACTTEIDKANVGDDVYVKAITGTLEGATVIWTDGTIAATEPTPDSGIYAFEMPAGSVTAVTATISYSLADADDPDEVKFYSDDACTIEITRANVGDAVYVRAILGTLIGVTVTYDGDGGTPIIAAEYGLPGSGIYRFLMPAGAVTDVTASF